MNQLFYFFVSVAIAQVFDCFGAICYCCHHFFSMCDGGLGKLYVAKLYFVYEVLVSGGFYVVPMCTIMFRSCR